MKTKQILAAIAVVLIAVPVKMQAQIGRSDWSYGLVLHSNNPVYAEAGNLLKALPAIIANVKEDDKMLGRVEEFYGGNRWWIPDFRYRSNVVQKMEFADGKATLYPKGYGFSNMDWGLNTYAIGYHVGYLPRVGFLGFDIQADYAQDGYQIKMPNTEEKIKIVKRMFSATALLRLRLLKYDSNRLNPVIEFGGSYNYAFHYHDNVINDNDAVNNGFTGIVGLGFTNTETHVSWSLRYEHAFYDFYNKDFMYEGVPVFDGSKSTIGRLSIAITYAL